MYVSISIVRQYIVIFAATHINDLKDEYIKQGYDEEKALESAVLAMGNCDEIGIRLNKQHKPQAEWSFLC